MEEGKYPGICLGTYHELNENGKALVSFGDYEYRTRVNTADYLEGKEWRTFRDGTKEPKFVYSLYTKSVARPLKKQWMDAIGSTCSIKNGDI